MTGLSYQQVKPKADFCLALLLLIVACPVIFVSLILVRLTSRGPAIYSQKRLGLRGRLITIYKIRTMYQNCERDTGAVWSLPGDPRVTPVGRFLRWSHLDELPQLFNVVRGEMSLIGPRPERPEIIAKLEKSLPDYRQRLEVRPGLTGLAQVLQPPDTDLDSVSRKLELDLHYLREVGPWMDFRIFLATPLHVVHVPESRIAGLFGFPTDELQPAATLDECRSHLDDSQVTPYYAG
ncbi:sugar transferase [Aquisphaera insulae]|uniref:sugar transferase n=1 Tax=Aquisphaera insulae TaxID=2712864 RepID=UPI00202F95EF|nr:sugar transferase [Aquisphaera insulae]